MPTVQQLLDILRERDKKASPGALFARLIDTTLQAQKALQGATPIPITQPALPAPLLPQVQAQAYQMGPQPLSPVELLTHPQGPVSQLLRAYNLAQTPQVQYELMRQQALRVPYTYTPGLSEFEKQRLAFARTPEEYAQPIGGLGLPQVGQAAVKAVQTLEEEAVAPLAGRVVKLGEALGFKPGEWAFQKPSAAKFAEVFTMETDEAREFLREQPVATQVLAELTIPLFPAEAKNLGQALKVAGRAGRLTAEETRQVAVQAVPRIREGVLRGEAGMVGRARPPARGVPSELAERTLRPTERPYVRRAGVAAEETFWGAERMAGRPREQLVDDLARYITDAKKFAATKVGLRHRQLQRTAAILGKQRETAEGMRGVREAERALAGRQPLPEYEPPFAYFTPGEANQLADMIIEADLRSITYAATSNAFLKAFVRGETLTMSEIARLEKVFGPKLAKALMEQKGLPARMLYQVLDVLNLPRAFIASFDFSYPLRQAVVPTVAHPTEAVRSFKAMLQSIDENTARQIASDLERHPSASLWDQVGLDYNVPWERGARSVREDAFASRLADKFPGIRASQRVFVTYGNKLRTEMFETYRRNWEAVGRTFETHPDDYRALARWCNISSGRGEVKWIREFLPSLNAVFFSPRLLISRVQMPLELFTTTPAARRLVARDLAIFTMTGMTTLAALKVSGIADIELDPRSSDFGKAKIGKTRLDFWGGLQPIARYTAQLITGQGKYPARPGIPKITGIDRETVVGRLLWSKMAPGPGLITDIVMGRTFIGQEIDFQPKNIKEQVFNRLTPLFIQDLYDATKQAGLKGFALGMPGVLGVGIQTYERANEKEIAFLQEIEGVLTDDEKAALERGVVPNIIREMPEWQAIQDEKAQERREKPTAQEYQADLDQRNALITQVSEDWEAGRITGVDARQAVAEARNEFRIKNEMRDFPGGGFLDAFYKATYDRATDQETGVLDLEKLDEYISEWEQTATPEELAAITEHELAADNPMERQLREDRVYIRDSGYWELDDSLWEYAQNKGVKIDGKKVYAPRDVASRDDFLAGYAEWKTAQLVEQGTPQDQAVTLAWGYARNLPLVKKLASMLSDRRADERDADPRLRQALLRWYKPISQEEMGGYGFPVP